MISKGFLLTVVIIPFILLYFSIVKTGLLSSFYNLFTSKRRSSPSEKKKVLFLFWHGLGDNILATPVIKQYKQTTGNYIGWAMLRRFRSAGLFDDNPHIDRLHWIPDAWNDFKNYSHGCRQVIKEGKAIKKEFGYDEICIIDHKSSSGHKIHRTAFEMGIGLDNDLHTQVYYDPEKIRPLYESISLPEEYVFFHGKTGAASKDLPLEKAREWLNRENIDLPVVSPDFTWDCREYPVAFAMDVMKRAKHIVVADSVMYHAAHAMDLYVDCAYFARGKEAWQVVHPLHPAKENVIFAI